jgi:hypothetical protein
MFNWTALAANRRDHLLVREPVPCQRTLSGRFSKVHAEESALAHAVKGRGTSWVETLRQHGNLANATTVAAQLQKKVEEKGLILTMMRPDAILNALNSSSFSRARSISLKY